MKVIVKVSLKLLLMSKKSIFHFLMIPESDNNNGGKQTTNNEINSKLSDIKALTLNPVPFQPIKPEKNPVQHMMTESEFQVKIADLGNACWTVC